MSSSTPKGSSGEAAITSATSVLRIGIGYRRGCLHVGETLLDQPPAVLLHHRVAIVPERDDERATVVVVTLEQEPVRLDVRAAGVDIHIDDRVDDNVLSEVGRLR